MDLVEHTAYWKDAHVYDNHVKKKKKTLKRHWQHFLRTKQKTHKWNKY